MIRAKVSESSTLALLQRVRELKASGRDIVSFAAGESDFPTPKVVADKACEAIREGDTRYVYSGGIPKFREAVARDYQKRLGVSWARPEHVVVSFGSKQGIYLALSALLNRDDEVLIPRPYWVSYPHVVEAAGGHPHFIECKEENGGFPTVEELDRVYTPRCKALLFSSPSNPTGAVISKAQLEKIVKWCVSRKVTLIYDEIYERLVYRGAKHVCALSLCSEADSEFVIAVNACSKSMAMTGWRLGYMVSHPDNIKALVALQSQMATCVAGFIQQAGAEGLDHAGEYLPEVVTAFEKRLDLMEKGLSAIPNVRFMKPQGAFYIFVNVEKAIGARGLRSDVEFCERILEDKGLAMTPGQPFGMPGWVRFSFATSEKELSEGLKRLSDFCK